MHKYKFNFKRFLSFFIILVLFLTSFQLSEAYAALSPPDLNSEGVTLFDADTGQILFSKNGDTKYFPASTTKIITATLVLKNKKLDEVVTIGKNPPLADGSSIYVKEGEKFTIKELLLGLLLESGNDCAGALAEYVAGSNENFAEMMNKFAKEIGAVNSHFTNPSGLPDDNHYTTPNDLALFMGEAIKDPEFVDLTKTAMVKLPPSNLDGEERWLNNHNSILLKASKYFYQYCFSAKRGYTGDAKFTNIIASEKDGHRLIASFLKGPSIEKVYDDAKAIFDYGYNNFTKNRIYSKGEEIGTFKINDNISIPLKADDDVYYTTKIADKDKLNASLDYKVSSTLRNKAIKSGDVMAKAKVLIDGNEIQDVNLISGADRPYSTTMAIGDFFTEHKLFIGMSMLLLLIVFLICFSSYKRIKKRNKFKNKWQKVITVTKNNKQKENRYR